MSSRDRMVNNYSAPDRGAEYCDERVCLCVSVCLSAIISSELHVRSSPIFVHVAYGRGSVLLWRRSDTLCTSDFMDDIIFAHKPIKVARRRRPTVAQCTRSLGLGYKLCAVISVAGQQTHGTTFRALRVTSRWRWQQHRGRSLRSMTALFKLLDALIDGSRG